MPDKHQIAFRFSTPRGDYFDVTTDGNIIRLDQPGFQPSGKWKFIGMQHTKIAHEFISFERILYKLAHNQLPELKFKTSGNPTYTVVDYDHGTQRVWGNTKWHGIRSICQGETL